MTNFLVLIKHTLPVLDFTQPASNWRASTEGLQRCYPLASHLSKYNPTLLFSSPELKAFQTAQVLSKQFHCDIKVVHDLHEHERPDTGGPNESTFKASVQSFFDHPAELVFGAETADQTYTRFSSAVDSIINRPPKPDLPSLVLVTHGTVISLFVSRRTGTDPFSLWQKLGLPSLVALSLPNYRISEMIGNFPDQPHISYHDKPGT